MKIFVTGATGYLGAVAADALAAREHEVLGLARSQPSASALRERGITPVMGDFGDPGSLANAVHEYGPTLWSPPASAGPAETTRPSPLTVRPSAPCAGSVVLLEFPDMATAKASVRNAKSGPPVSAEATQRCPGRSDWKDARHTAVGAVAEPQIKGAMIHVRVEHAGMAATIDVGGDLTVYRFGFGAMRITGDGIWGEPAGSPARWPSPHRGRARRGDDDRAGTLAAAVRARVLDRIGSLFGLPPRYLPGAAHQGSWPWALRRMHCSGRN
jgi:hypothetical protein